MLSLIEAMRRPPPCAGTMRWLPKPENVREGRMAPRREMAVREEDTTKTPTIYMALDLGHRRWTVGVLLPGDRDARLFQVAGGDREALSELIRRRRQLVGDPGVRVVSCYEGGREGLWLYRW